MFAVVCADESANRGVLRRLRHFLFGARLRVVRCELEGGFYYRIVADCGFDGLNWDELAAVAGKCAGQLLLPPGISPPADCGCARFNTDRYRRELLTEAAIGIIAAAAESSPQICVGLVDIGANTAQLVDRLLEHAASVSVMTARVSEYEAYAAEVYRQMGVSPLIGDDTGVFEHCSVILAPYGLGGVSRLNFGGVIFAPGEQGCIDVLSDTLSLPEGIELPPKILPFDFAAACRQTLGREEYIHLPFMLGTVGGAQIDVKRLIDKI